MTSNIEVFHSKMLTTLNTFAMPASARTLVRLHDLDGISELETLSGWDWTQVQILGGGSNSLFTEDLGWVLHLQNKGRVIAPQDHAVDVIAAAGENWDEFVDWCLDQELFGLENLSWIPGSVGAAPIQNIGAYGVEVATCIRAVQVYDPVQGVFHWIDGQDCGFGYRDSHFKKQWSNLLITHVRFRLSPVFNPVLEYGPLRSEVGNKNLCAKQLRDRIIALRQAKLPDPDKLANAGSFFKNPIVTNLQKERLLQKFPGLPWYPVTNNTGMTDDKCKLPAAWLLDNAGFKGQWHEHFGCYHLQPLVLVHDRDQPGSLAEKSVMLFEFIQLITTAVSERFSVSLEIEPVFALPSTSVVQPSKT